MRIAFYEDDGARHLAPIALTRPVFELLCGRMSLRERMLRNLNPTDWGVVVRSYLAESYGEANADCHVNDTSWLAEAPTLLVNGRCLVQPDALRALKTDEAAVLGEAIAAVWIEPSEVALLETDSPGAAWQQIRATRNRVPVSGTEICFPWDVVDHNHAQLIADFAALGGDVSRNNLGPQVSILGDAESVWVDPTATVDPFVVLDAREGPVSIATEAKIGSFTQLQGPCHVGPQSQLLRAQVRGGTTIGPGCRVGGEVEASILHGFVNKYHDGFLGHSYVCPWVNLAADTTTSDLKSDYSKVGVPLSGKMIDSGRAKVGSFIGDHTKTALNSLFNVGSSVGVMTNILPAGKLLPKHIPSFSRVWHGELTDGVDLESSFKTAEIVMQRRGQTLAAADRRLFQYLFDATAAERADAIGRFRRKAARERSKSA